MIFPTRHTSGQIATIGRIPELSIIGGQVRADDFPGISLIRRFKKVIASEIKRIYIAGREN